MMQIIKIKKFGKSGIRTHEAEAEDLKSSPFNHSGILPYFNEQF
jgi:hypothetical protein